MGSEKTAFFVGLFVISGLGIAITAIIWLGMSNYFDKGNIYAAYFDESVQGLNKDSPVKYRGVSIGRVHSIGVAPDATLIQILVSVEKNMTIEPDMIAQLKSVGITGIMFIELDRKNPAEPDRSPILSFTPEYPVIKTKPSGITLFLEGMDLVLEQIKRFDAKGLSDKLKTSMESFNTAISDAELHSLSLKIQESLTRLNTILEPEKWDRVLLAAEKAVKSFNAMTATLHKTIQHTDTNINMLSGEASRAISSIDVAVSKRSQDFEKALADFRTAVNSIDAVVKKGAGLMDGSKEKLSLLERHLVVILQNLEIASNHLNSLMQVLSDQPSQVVFGEPIPIKEADFISH